MNEMNWYTDTMDVFRDAETTVGNLTNSAREQVGAGIPCRIYQSGKPPITMRDTAAEVRSDNKLVCPTDTDLRKGDELIIHRGALIGGHGDERCFVGGVQDYFEPFGAVIPGLAHKEATITGRERA